MATYPITLPELGEGVIEATITKWLVQVGDTVQEDDIIAEIATDKVDSDIPSPQKGIVKELLFQVNEVVPIGASLAIIDTEEISTEDVSNPIVEHTPSFETTSNITNSFERTYDEANSIDLEKVPFIPSKITFEKNPLSYHSENELKPGEVYFKDRLYSPLVKNIVRTENISQDELSLIKGSGSEGRVTKYDVLNYLDVRHTSPTEEAETITDLPLDEEADLSTATELPVPIATQIKTTDEQPVKTPLLHSGEDEIIEMDRMRKMIADHMIMSKQVSPHVSSFVEADVTAIVKWRDRIKDEFFKREGEKITYMPVFIQAVAKAIKDFPLINVQVEDNKILVKKNINIGIAVALPTGNLIVPVIKDADRYNLVGLTRVVNDLANRAREGNLKPHEIKGGTYTITNLGSFGNIFGTPIINQPQVAILALGAIQKKVSVIESPKGEDMIGIRHKMYLSHSYDHRVVDGALGGLFVKCVADYLHDFVDKI